MRITPSPRDQPPAPCDAGLMPETVTPFRRDEKTFPPETSNFPHSEDKASHKQRPRPAQRTGRGPKDHLNAYLSPHRSKPQGEP
ncbi:hypothetical protein GCM10010402_46350 [Actinomadura luteofluorescens]